MRLDRRSPVACAAVVAATAPASARRRVAIGIQIGGLTEAERELFEGARPGQRSGSGGRPSGGMGSPGGMGGSMGGPSGGIGGTGPGGGPPPGEDRSFREPDIVWLVADLVPVGGTSQR